MPADDLDSLWLPFTPNRHFREARRILVRAKGMYFFDRDGRALLDTCSGLWCVNAGHGQPQISHAIAAATEQLDFSPTFQFSHPDAIALAGEIAALAPKDLAHVFFVNSGSEACDAALKLSRAYFHRSGRPAKTRLVGRERGYHGVSFGGISVGGIEKNRERFGPLLPGTEDHLPLAYDRNAAGGQGDGVEGERYADALEHIVEARGADAIAAVIVEPFAGSAGVFPPPEGYLKRLRSLCDKHDILLIFDEVISGFGRLGSAFAAQRYGVSPDMITFAKGVTNGAVPMGGVLVSRKIRAAFSEREDHAIEFFHGHTYSGHPLAAAAGRAALRVYREQQLFARGRTLEDVLAAAVRPLSDAPRVTDIRCAGVAAGIDIEPDPAAPGRRGYEAMRIAFDHENMVIRVAGDTIALAPALVANDDEIGRMVEGVRRVLSRLA
ncbi:MAG: aminotransferase class III-fold pyridoxal phosphate-dependent enzyme [Alphaproteobacteria bacterium]|nr:aminotransferase class III-fold pyridoxal phosphate-dependent enzyme [Alphaproteobacteria bacterium]